MRKKLEKITLSKSQILFLRRRRPIMTVPEITVNFNNKYGTQYSEKQISYLCRVRLGIIVGIGFRPNEEDRSNVPSRDVTLYRSSRFKKGNKPCNTAEVGYERLYKDNHIRVKTANGWRLKQRVVWEQYHGEIPKGYIIYFKDGDTSNCDISNLECVKKGVITIANSCMQFNNYSSDMRETVFLLAQIKHATHHTENRF